MSGKRLRYYVRKEICDKDNRFLCYKYYSGTMPDSNIPEWADDRKDAIRYTDTDTAHKRIEAMRFLVPERMSVEEFDLDKIR